jgi:hypothetical protein
LFAVGGTAAAQKFQRDICFRERFRTRAPADVATLVRAGIRKRSRFQKFEDLELKAAIPSKAVATDTFSTRRHYGENDPYRRFGRF